MHVIAAKAVAFQEALQPEFIDYQNDIVKNAKRMGEKLLESGFKLVSGGTDTHLVLVDLRGTDITGQLAEETLEKAGMEIIADWITEAFENNDNDKVLNRIRDEVKDLCSKFPIYSHKLV